MILPPALLSAADQEKAYCDAGIRKLAGKLKQDIADGIDPTFLWYSLSAQLATQTPSYLASAAMAAVLQLAQKPTTHPKGRVAHSDQGFTGTCGCCGHPFEGDHYTVLNNLDRHMRTGWKPSV